MDGLDPVAEAIRQWRAHDLGAQAHMEAVANVNRLSQLVVARIEATLREFDMTFPQYEALLLLDFAQDGALPLGRMGRRLTVHPTTVTNTVDHLERKGLVEREHTPDDRRRVLARITKEGRKRSTAASKALAEIRFGLEGMKIGEAREISGAIAHYREAMGDRV